MFSVIILAAGSGQRFGCPKALANISGQPNIVRLVSNLQYINQLEIIVVVGAKSNRIKPLLLNHKNIKIVYNKHHKFGQTSSFKEGLRHTSKKSKGFFLLPVDYPFITPKTLTRMITSFNRKKIDILVPQHKSRRGHPPLFHSSLKKKLLLLNDHVGVSTVLHDKKNSLGYFITKDTGATLTFNTKRELNRIKRLFKK